MKTNQWSETIPKDSAQNFDSFVLAGLRQESLLFKKWKGKGARYRLYEF